MEHKKPGRKRMRFPFKLRQNRSVKALVKKRNGIMDKDKRPYPTKARERIQAGMIITRLQKHLKGELEMTSTQIQAARILLGKALPDLQAIEHSGNVDSKAARTMTDDELDRAIEAERQRLSGVVAGTEKAKAGKKQRRSLH